MAFLCLITDKPEIAAVPSLTQGFGADEIREGKGTAVDDIRLASHTAELHQIMHGMECAETAYLDLTEYAYYAYFLLLDVQKMLFERMDRMQKIQTGIKMICKFCILKIDRTCR